MEEGSLDSIRNLQIFYDARCLSGIKDSLLDLKYIIFDYQKNHPFLLKRFMDSVMHIKKAIGPLGQIILEEKGKHQVLLISNIQLFFHTLMRFEF